MCIAELQARMAVFHDQIHQWNPGTVSSTMCFFHQNVHQHKSLLYILAVATLNFEILTDRQHHLLFILMDAQSWDQRGRSSHSKYQEVG